MPKCAAYNCKNIGVHRFPKEPKRRKLWERSLKRKNWISTASSRLCSAHFKTEDYYGKSAYTGIEPVAKFLKRSAVPTIFSFTKKETPVAREQQARLDRRSKNNLTITSIDTISSVKAEPEEIEIKVDVDVHDVDVHNVDETPHVIHNVLLDKSTQVNTKHVYGCINSFKNDDSAIAFYTGFESYEKFSLVFLTLSPMVKEIKYYGSSVRNVSAENQFFLTLMKLRQLKCNFELSRFFDISPTTASNVFITWINFIHFVWTKLNILPEEDLFLYMPDSFKRFVSITREQNTQNPQKSQQALCIPYVHTKTQKLVGVTPGGVIRYYYKSFTESVSDHQTVKRSDLVQKCKPEDMLANNENKLKGKSQISSLAVLSDRKLASKRVDIEHLIGLMKTYKILKNDLNHSYIPLASKIFFVCFMCSNFREEKLIKK